ADFTETREPIGNSEKTIFFQTGDISRDIPAVLENFGSFFRASEIALHYIWSLDQKHSRLIWRKRLHGFRIHDAHDHAWQRVTDGATARANLAKTRSAEVAAIDCHNGRALSTTVTLQWTYAKKILECQGHAFRELFRANQDVLQAAKVFRRATAHVGLQECRSGYQECDSIPRNQFADGFCGERIGMEDNADPVDRGEPQGDGESKGVEERKDAKHFVVAIEHENLGHLANVGKNIVVGKHYALGVTSTAAGKNNCRQIFCGGGARV